MPWNTPVVPLVMVAACRSVSSPSPAASHPIILTSSSRNGWNRPMALLPPPTQATRQSGILPSASTHWERTSRPMTLWNSQTISGNGCGPMTVPMT